MDQSHPTFEDLENFFLKDGKKVNSAKVIIHLLKGCVLCGSRIRCIYGAPPGPSLEFLERRATHEREKANRTWKGLQLMNPERREKLILGTKSYQTWSLFSLLIDRSRTVIHQNPA